MCRRDVTYLPPSTPTQQPTPRGLKIEPSSAAGVVSVETSDRLIGFSRRFKFIFVRSACARADDDDDDDDAALIVRFVSCFSE